MLNPPLSQTLIFLSQVQDMISVATPIPLKPTFVPMLMHSASPSPPSSASMSPDHCDLPPSSLEDQVHDAYALEDIHLAKILLLRLKGIEVTSDDDPRIAAVQDEDFDFCFMPNGPLLNEQDEQALKEIQSKELEHVERLRWVERMRVCERKWVEEKQKMRKQKVAELRRRERKRLEEEEEERRRASRASDIQRAALRSKTRADRKIVSYDHLNLQQSRSDRDQHFVYNFMITGPPSPPPRPSPTASPAPLYSRRCFPSPVFDDSRTVTFRDVLKSIDGRLFPFSDEERIQYASNSMSRSRTPSRSICSRRNRQLLHLLLAEVEYSDNERRKRNGKDNKREQCLRSFCLACSVFRKPVPSLSTTSSSRTSSWLSFRTTTSASSLSTDLTTPSTSPIPSGKALWLASRPQSWVSSSTHTDVPLSVTPFRHSCRAHNPLTPILLSEGPLVMDVNPSSAVSSSLSYKGRTHSSRVRASKEGAGMLKRVSKIVEFAKGVQNAYVSAALFSVAVPYKEGEERHSIFNARKENAALRPFYGQSYKPAGFRASTGDVKSFLAVYSSSNGGADDELEDMLAPKYIPLVSPYCLIEPPRTVLPDPLPYQLHFKPIPPPIRSPFRHYAHSEMHTMYPSRDSYPELTSSAALLPGRLSWRIRCVGNPVYLRLKALHNIVWKRGVHWEGSGRETAMGGGKERVIGVAYEYVGRSNLSYCYSTLD